MASGVIKSWVVPSSYKTEQGNSYAGAYWSVEWSSAPKEGVSGVSVITFDIWKRGRTSSPTWLYTYCKLNIIDDQTGETVYTLDTGKLHSSSTKDADGNAVISFGNSRYKKNQSFEVQHNDKGVGSFTVKFSVYIYEYTFHNTSKSAAADENFPYTKCTAPTTATLSTKYVAPSGKITVNWSGAAAGEGGNNIKGYEVYYLVSENGAAPTAENYTGSATINDATSLSITLSSAIRGHKVSCIIRTLGTAGDLYNSDWVACAGTAIVNTKPSKPTVTGSVTLPTSGGSVALTTQAGNSNNTGQTASVYYKKGSGDYTAVSSNKLIITAAGTYYFVTWDGCEYSDAVKKVVARNSSKPTVEVEVSGTTNTVSWTLPSDASYVTSVRMEFTDGGGNGDTTKRRYYVAWANTKSVLEGNGPSSLTDLTSSTNAATYTSGIFSDTIITSATTKTISDIREYMAGLNGTSLYSLGAKYYRLGSSRYDGLEWSDITYSDTIYYIARAPQISGWYNNDNLEATDFDKYCANKLYFKCEYDSSLKQYYSFTELNGSVDQTDTFNLAKIGTQYSYGNSPLLNCNRLTNFKVGIQFKISKDCFFPAIYSENWQRFATYDLGRTGCSANEINAHSTTEELNLTITNWLGNVDNLSSAEALKPYGLSPDTPVKLTLASEWTLTEDPELYFELDICTIKDFHSDTTNDSLVYACSNQKIREMLKKYVDADNSVLDKNLLACGIGICIATRYGGDYAIPAELDIYFIDTAVTILDTSIKVQNGEDFEYFDDNFIIPTSVIEGILEFESYNTIQTASLQVYNYKNNSKLVQEIRTTSISQNGRKYEIAKTTPYTVTINIGDGLDFSKINEEAEFYFVFTANNSNNIGVVSTIGQTKSSGDITAAVQAVDFVPFDEKIIENIEMTYVKDDAGAKDSYYLSTKFSTSGSTTSKHLDAFPNFAFSVQMRQTYAGTQLIEETSQDSDFWKEQILQYNKTYNGQNLTCSIIQSDMAYVSLKVTTTLADANGNFGITKTFLSNELPVYALLPTVSYRKNYINLNRKTVPDNIANNGVAYIGAYQSKTKVFFLGSSSGQDVVSSVDLNTGALDNFVIDCGSW